MSFRMSGNGDFCRFAVCSEAFVFCLEWFIEEGGDEGRQYAYDEGRLLTRDLRR